MIAVGIGVGFAIGFIVGFYIAPPDFLRWPDVLTFDDGPDRFDPIGGDHLL